MEPEVLTKIEDADPIVPQLSAAKATSLPDDASDDPSYALNLDHDDDDDDDGEDGSSDHESLYEELLDGESETYEHVKDVCTPDEARDFRRRLHELGLEKFVEETLGRGIISPQKLMTAFGVKLPSWLVDAPISQHYRLLGLALVRELNKRQRLAQYKTIDDAAQLINQSRNIVVVTGAGVSTSLGIPDFRSKNTGFYSRLQERGFSEPEDVFDLRTFDDDPTLFYSLAGEILPELNKWTPTHQFIRVIQDKNKLLRNYTQNIDNIESHAGIDPAKLIQCHGSWAHATCRKCNNKVPGEQIFASIKAKQVAKCKNCSQTLHAVRNIKRKRTPNALEKSRKRHEYEDDDSDGQYDIPEPGVMKPDITFFGEKLPDQFFDTLQNEDREKVDLVIVIGTSMKVAPVSEIPQFVPANVPQIYISKEPIHHINFDINLLGDCDTVVKALCDRADWTLKHEMLPSDQEVVVQPHEVLEHTYYVRVKAVDIA